jgi:hypothetical protein
MSELNVESSRAHGVGLAEWIYGPPRSGRRQSLRVGGTKSHELIFSTRAFRELQGQSGGESGVNDDLVRHSFKDVDATIMVRTMCGPVRAEWGDVA